MTNDIWDDADIISSYQPELIRNERNPQPTPPADLESMLHQFSGTYHYHVDTGLLLTDGTKWLLDSINGYQLPTIILDHLLAITSEIDAFIVIDINRDGTVTIYDGCEPQQHLALSQLDLSLPCNLRLYTGRFLRYLVVMLASEY